MVTLMSELQSAQAQLLQALRDDRLANQGLNVDVPALNINAIQKELAVFDNNKVSTTPLDPHKHTAYLINHASDLTKLIKFIFFNGQLE